VSIVNMITRIDNVLSAAATASHCAESAGSSHASHMQRR